MNPLFNHKQTTKNLLPKMDNSKQSQFPLFKPDPLSSQNQNIVEEEKKSNEDHLKRKRTERQDDGCCNSSSEELKAKPNKKIMFNDTKQEQIVPNTSHNSDLIAKKFINLANNYNIKINHKITVKNQILNEIHTIKDDKTIKINPDGSVELGTGTKIAMRQIMDDILQEIPTSTSANILNGEKNMAWKAKESKLFNNIINSSDLQTTKNLLITLKLSQQNKNYVCNQLAMRFAIELRAKYTELKEHIYVCKINGHVMVSIGDPKKSTSTVVDLWTKYLNTKNFEGKQRTASNKSHGYFSFGGMQDYKKFIQLNHNKYTGKFNTANDVNLEVYTTLSENSKQITPEDIHQPFSVEEKLIIDNTEVSSLPKFNDLDIDLYFNFNSPLHNSDKAYFNQGINLNSPLNDYKQDFHFQDFHLNSPLNNENQVIDFPLPFLKPALNNNQDFPFQDFHLNSPLNNENQVENINQQLNDENQVIDFASLLSNPQLNNY